MNRLTVMSRALAVCAIASAIASPVSSAELALPRDGWVSWEVAAVDDAPNWCCWSDSRPGTAPKPCRLDGFRDGYSSRDGETTDTVRVYARLNGGKVERVRALSATCPVHAGTEIQDIGKVAADDSARWIAMLLQPANADIVTRRLIGKDALAALAIHEGNIAQQALATIAASDARDETRKEAVFWLAHLRGREGAEVVTAIMFNDKDPDVREHAAFAVSLSKSPQAASDLIRLANTDRNAQVRGQGWFWLAKTEAAGAERAIDAALRKEGEDSVREQAIFALSQLPEDRATRALIAVAQDKSLRREDRKRAVFWLSQSESAAAQAYLEQVITARRGD